MSLLPPALQLPPPEQFASELQERLSHWPQVCWSAQSPSTNTELLNTPPLQAPALLGTHWQHQGRGRAGRDFVTAAGQALTFSCAFDTRLPIAALPTLGIWFAVHTCLSLRALVTQPERLSLKWPNDLNWDNGKLAGMLLETRARAREPGTRVVMGLGLNLAPGQELSQQLGRDIAGWSDTGATLPAAALVAQLCLAWEQALQTAENEWTPATALAALPAYYARCDQLAGQEVNLLEQGRILATGQACGVGTDGRLRILTSNGILPCSVGDISVRLRP